MVFYWYDEAMLRREVHTRGIVVSRRAAGEGSVRVELYTEELGLVSAIAKSAREERSKLRPHLLVGTRGTYSLVRGKEVWRLTGAVKTKNFAFECVDDEGRCAGARLVSVVRQFVHGEGTDEGLFDALWNFYEVLSDLPPTHVAAAERIAVLQLLSSLGYVPQDPEIQKYLVAAYKDDVLSDAERDRRTLVTAINEGFAASGL